MSFNRVSRRRFLRGVTVVAGAGALAACSTPAPTPQVTKETVIVKETVAIEKIITAVPGEGKCTRDWTTTFPPAKRYDPVVKISTPFPAAARFLYKDSYTDNPFTRQRLEHLGIEYTVHWQADGDLRTQKLQADIAAGTLPDLFAAQGTMLSALIENGALAEIKEVWESIASPLVKQKKLYPDGRNWAPARRGAELYGVAFSYGAGYNVDNLGYIRQDWLDKLGLKTPTTLDELTAVMKAFKANKLATWGISACKNLVTWYQSLDPVFGAFGAMPTIWRSMPDGSLQYGSIQPEVKEALAVIRGWYADGLLDPDFYTKGEGDAAANLNAERIGVHFSPWWAVLMAQDMEKVTPGMVWSVMPAPKGPTGKSGRKASPIAGPAAVFRKGVEPIKIEAALNHLNWQMEMHVNFDQYGQYGEYASTFWEEGYGWVWGEDCQLKEGPAPVSYVYADEVGFGYPFICYPDYQKDSYAEISRWREKDPATLNKPQKFLLSNQALERQIASYTAVTDTLDIAIADEYLAPPTPRMTKLLPDLTALESETFIGIVVGQKPLDAFDEFVTAWLAKGGEEVTADVNDWKKTL